MTQVEKLILERQQIVSQYDAAELQLKSSPHVYAKAQLARIQQLRRCRLRIIDQEMAKCRITQTSQNPSC
jgi:hypothetical protein